jgi:alpha-glucosidase
MYHEYIGTFKLPPLWFFGFHQSRWGYSSASQLQKVIDGYRDADLKLESIFLDIDYMVNKKPFKIDITNFPLLELMSIKKK